MTPCTNDRKAIYNMTSPILLVVEKLNAFKGYAELNDLSEVTKDTKLYSYEGCPAVILSDEYNTAVLVYEKEGKIHEQRLENKDGVPYYRWWDNDKGELTLTDEPAVNYIVRDFCQRVKNGNNHVYIRVEQGEVGAWSYFYRDTFSGWDEELGDATEKKDYLFLSLTGHTYKEFEARFGDTFELCGDWVCEAIKEEVYKTENITQTEEVGTDEYLRYNVRSLCKPVFRTSDWVKAEFYAESAWQGYCSLPKFVGYYNWKPCYHIDNFQNQEVLVVLDDTKPVIEGTQVKGSLLVLNKDVTNPEGNQVGEYLTESGRVYYKTGYEAVSAQEFITWVNDLGENAYNEYYKTEDSELAGKFYYVVRGYDRRKSYPQSDYGWKRVIGTGESIKVIKALVSSKISRDSLLGRELKGVTIAQHGKVEVNE